MICIKCGQELPEGTKFCTKCGYTLVQAPGSMFIKITGILFIVFGAFGVISLITSMATKLVAVPVLNTILNFISNILGVALGIAGVLYCKNLDKAKLLQNIVYVFIGFLIVASIPGTIFSLNQGQSIAIVLGSLFAGLIIWAIIVACFIIGVRKNLKAK